MSFNVILGIDFLTDSRATLDCSRQMLSLYDGLVIAALTTRHDRSELVVLSHNVVIPPHSEAIVPVRVHNKFNSIVSLVETLPSLHGRLLAVAAAAVSPIKSTTMCRMINLGLKAKRLKAGLPIATMAILDMQDDFNRNAFNRWTRSNT